MLSFSLSRAALRAGFVAYMACASVASTNNAWAGDTPATVQDSQGRQIKISDTSRIISIGGAVTEILYALGFEDRIIAVDTSSLYPPKALKEKQNVGYLRQLSPEGVLGLGPSLVLAADGAGPKESVAVLEQASVPFVLIPEKFTGEGIVERIRLIATATGTTARGECLVKDVEADLARLADLRKKITKPVRVAFVMSVTNGKAMVSGRDTVADAAIKLAGAENVFSDIEGFKSVSDEAIVAAQPELILGIKRGDAQLTSAQIFDNPAFGLTPAAKNKNYISMDGLYLLGFGPRAARAIADLAHQMYPELAQIQVAETENSASCKE